MLFQFKIQLKNIIKPPVWRKVLVPDSFSLDKLHEVIQKAFGWNNAHLYQFSKEGYGSYPNYGVPDGASDDMKDSRKVKLSKIFDQSGQKYTYIYDFGDDWVHAITLEEIKEGKASKAELLSGKGACPPEDCGGPWGYQRLLETLANPADEEHADMREWLGLNDDDIWDANEFNLADAKINVAEIK